MLKTVSIHIHGKLIKFYSIFVHLKTVPGRLTEKLPLPHHQIQSHLKNITVNLSVLQESAQQIEVVKDNLQLLGRALFQSAFAMFKITQQRLIFAQKTKAGFSNTIIRILTELFSNLTLSVQRKK